MAIKTNYVQEEIKLKQGDLVVVQWVDSIKTHGWVDIPQDIDTSCQTVGMFIQKQHNYITIALNKSAYGYGDYMSIPLCAVKKIRRLK